VLMADAYGDDARLVAFMTYLRVALVAVAASLVAKFATSGGAPVAAAEWFPPIDWVGLAGTLCVVAAGIAAALFTKIRAGGMLVPMFLGAALQDFVGLNIVLPPVLLTVCYALLGWTIGLRFTRDILGHAARAFPAILGSMLALIAICGVFALLLVQFAGVDPLTAYLATSPGGADSVAIIAANSHVDLPFVMAMQAGRLIVVMLTGPALARWIATRDWLHKAA
jgi:membrane AbrB-like protein